MASPMPSPQTALVLGGDSDIATATLRRLALDGLQRAVLAVRDAQATQARLTADPLPIEVTIEPWDARDPHRHEPLLQRAAEVLGDIDVVICAVGSLGHGAGISAEPSAVAALISSNFTGPASAITAAAHQLQRQGHGAIVVLSSVAGLRARKSNYLYGSAKAGLDAFIQGLADALVGSAVRVHLVRPGFVRTRMTEGLDPAPFATQPEVVAEAIAEVLRSPSSRIVHVPSMLGPLFGVFRILPRRLWRRVAGNR